MGSSLTGKPTAVLAAEEAVLLEDVWTRVRGFRVYARVARSREPSDSAPVVLVHGIGVSSRYMVPTARALAPSFRVAAPDLPGWGRSEKPGRALRIPELADVLAEWMEALGIPNATLVGNSMGCQLVVDLAVRRPERVERLVLVGPTVDRYARTFPRQAARLFLDSLREPLSLWAIIALDYLVHGPRRLLSTSRDALSDPLEEKLPLVEAPALVVRGARDQIVSQLWAEEVAALLPRARLAVVPGKAHAVNYNAPEELARLVEALVGES